MNIRTFHGINMMSVMTQIRQEVGPNAIILDSRRDKKGISVAVACEEEGETLSTTVHHYKQVRSNATIGQQITNCLEYHNIPLDIIAEMTDHFHAQMGDSAVDVLADALAALIALKPLNFASPSLSRLMLVGVPGAGKTTMIAKLAAMSSIEKIRPRIVTTDTMKAGAFQQMEIFANAMRLPLEVCATPHELQRYLETIPDGERVFIDTAGINPKDESELRRLAEFVLVTRQSPVFVLSAGEDPQISLDFASQFQKIGVKRMMLTRMDMVDRLGSVIAVAYRKAMTLVAISQSPYIARPFLSPRPTLLAKHLLQKAGILDVLPEDEGSSLKIAS